MEKTPDRRKWWQVLLLAAADRPLIWALIDYWGASRIRQIIAIAATIVLYGFFVGAVQGKLEVDWSFGIALSISMIIHELGHFYFFVRGSIKTRILFLFPLGAVAAPVNEEENKRSDLLHMNHLAWLVEAGPAMNIVLLVVTRLVMPYTVDETVRTFLGHIISINGVLAISNLIPVWNLDAGLLFKFIFSSLTEKQDRAFAAVQLVIIVVTLIILLAVPPAGLPLSQQTLLLNTVRYSPWIIVGIAVVLSVWHSQGMDDEKLSASEKSMSNTQIALHVFIYGALMVTALWIYAGPITTNL